MKHKPIPKSLREQVYRKYDGHCAYCGCELEYKDMQVDHAKSIWEATCEYAREHNLHIYQLDNDPIQDDSFENLMPACRQCNFYKGDYDIEHFRKEILETLQRTCRNTIQAKLALKLGILSFHPWDGKFYFEKQEKK